MARPRVGQTSGALEGDDSFADEPVGGVREVRHDVLGHPVVPGLAAHPVERGSLSPMMISTSSLSPTRRA